jgi:hypothetical protein
MTQNTGQIILYQTEDGITKIELKSIDNTVWLTQAEIAELFQKARSTIVEHIQNIFEENELDAESVCRNFRHTATDGKTYDVLYYSLDVILAVGYRVKSSRGTQFRKWATTTLKEYLIKGFALNDLRLKNPDGEHDYFEDLLERIRDIRSSEKRFYQKIRDIYKLAADYDPKTEETTKFFKIVQNKLHFSVSGKTAAEIIHERADNTKPNMGLTTWEGTKIRKSDVVIAKNYLNEEEMEMLNRIVTMYLDFAELQTQKRKILYMKDWIEKLDAFLKFNEKEILHDAGKITMEIAQKLAEEQYDAFQKNRLKKEAEDEDLDDGLATQIESIGKSKNG